MDILAEKPNVLLIITDHQAWYGHAVRPGAEGRLYELPVWDRFVSEGVCFERAYSVCPICTPARTSMMTGLYPSRHGLRWNTEYATDDVPADMRADQRLYSHYLGEAGYRNAYVGKWHCGHEWVAADYGIEGWSLPDYGKPYMSDEYRQYAAKRRLGDPSAYVEHWLTQPADEGREHGLYHDRAFYYENLSGVLKGPPEGHLDDFTSHLAAEKLRELAAGEEPWSLVASFWGPHHPYLPSKPYAGTIDPRSIPEYPTFNDDLATRPCRHWEHCNKRHGPPRKVWPEWETWQEVLARAYEQQVQTDAAIGRLLNTLEESGQAENTLVLWVCDHGDAVGCHGGVWDKGSTFIEETVRVPLAVRWPAAFEGGKRSRALVSNMDVTATMLAAAGVNNPGMASRSVLDLCRDPAGTEWPDALICEHNGHHLEILQRMVVTDRYKCVAALGDGDELYDLEDDPYETRNLVEIEEYAGVLKELRARLVQHIEETGDERGKKIISAFAEESAIDGE